MEQRKSYAMTPETQSKPCSRCGFGKRSTRDSYCEECRKLYTKEHRNRYQPKWREKNAEHVAKYKQEYNAEYFANESPEKKQERMAAIKAATYKKRAAENAVHKAKLEAFYMERDK
jgi:hypothetical protein